MSDTNGMKPLQPKPDPTLKELRRQRRLLEAKVELANIKRTQTLLESLDLWSGGWGSIVDPRDSLLGEPGFRPVRSNVSLPSDRQHGRNWPLWQNLTELGHFRQVSRILCQTNAQAAGVLENMTNYMVNTGYKYQAAFKKHIKPDELDEATLQAYQEQVDQVQSVVDEFLGDERLDNTQPWSRREREGYRRVLQDGECLFRFFGDDATGKLYVRFVEPEQLLDPPVNNLLGNGWSYGIRHHVEDDGNGGIIEDVERIEEYYVAYVSDPSRGEFVSGDEIVHIKNPKTPSTVKRGLPYFIFDTFDAFERAGQLQRYASIGAKIRAATAEIWQHETASKAQMQGYADSQTSFTQTNPMSGRQESLEQVAPGTVRRIPKGQVLVPGAAESNSAGYVEMVQADLRTGLAPFCAPEYFTGDASNANYASTKEAGAPFVKFGETEQAYYQRMFGACVWKAVLWAVKCGRLPGDVLQVVTLQVEAPHVLVRDPLVQAQTDQIEVQLGTKDRQTCAMEKGRDWDTVQANNAEWEEEHGQQGMGLPMPGDEGGMGDDGEGKDKVPGVPEGRRLRESVDDSGHQHKGKGEGGGQFTKGGGGGGGGASGDVAAPKSVASRILSWLKGGGAEGFASPKTPRRFDAAKFAAVEKHSAQVLESATPEQKHALGQYTGAYYSSINNRLRDGRKLSPDHEGVVKELDGLLTKAGDLPAPTMTYRGMILTNEEHAEIAAKLDAAAKSGDLVDLGGYQSTTTKPEKGAKYGSTRDEDSKGMTFEILARRGLHVKSESAVKGEDELLLPRDTKYKVVGKKEVPYVVAGGKGSMHVYQMIQV